MGQEFEYEHASKIFEIEVDERGTLLPVEQKINKLFIGGTVDLGFDEIKELKSLKIAENASAMKRQGQFQVISINFKDVKGSSYQETEVGIKDQVIELFANHHVTEDTGLLDNAQKGKLR